MVYGFVLIFLQKINSLIIKKYLHILFILISQFMVSQNDSIIKGKIIIETNDNEGVTIVNISNKTNTISGNDGYFKIKAKVNDTLIFSALHLEVVKQKVLTNDFNGNLLFVKMFPRSKQIEKILISNQTVITSENLGLVPKGQKKYTVAERRLYTGTSGPVEIVANLFTGNKKELKKNIEIEKKEKFQEKILNEFDLDFFVQTLKIPQEYVNGFLFYISEDKLTIEMLKNKDKNSKTLKLIDLSVEYLKIIEIKSNLDNKNTPQN